MKGYLKAKAKAYRRQWASADGNLNNEVLLSQMKIK